MKAFGKAMIEKTGEAIAKFLFWFIPDHKASLFLASIATGFAIGAGFVVNPVAIYGFALIATVGFSGAFKMAVVENMCSKEYKEERKQGYEDLKRTSELEDRKCDEIIDFCEEEDFTASNS